VYGPFVVAGILTDGTTPLDDVYSVLTVDSSFNMLFNHSDAGGALMVYGGAGRARRLLALSDDEIASTVTADLHELYPEVRVREVIVQRWENAIPFAAPGRAYAQAALERGVDGLLLLWNLPRGVIAASPELRVVRFAGTGVEMYVDLDEARAAGVAVCNVPSYAANAVAEHALALILAVARRVVGGDRE